MEEKEQKNIHISRKYLIIAGLSLAVIAASILIYFIFSRYDGINLFFRKVISILQPIIIGIVLAYILNPIANFWEELLLKLAGKMKKPEKLQKSARLISSIFTLILAAIVIAIGACLILPQIITSIVGLGKSIPEYGEQVVAWIQEHMNQENEIVVMIENALMNGSDNLTEWLRTTLLSSLQGILSYVKSGAIGFINTFINLIVGIVVSIYVLCSKKVFVGQGKKITYALFNKRHAKIILDTTRKSNQIFGGFISGKIIDSMIIGVITFIVLSILNMPYTVLISVLVGITNIIPFFGPYIGAIPSGFLILLVSPKQCIIFIIFIAVLQQIDGNIIGPKILGESTGLSAFWVVFSILLGSGLFGFVGMVIGVPAFAVIYYIVKTFMEHLLKKKKLPEKSEEYQEVDYIGNDEKMHYFK